MESTRTNKHNKQQRKHKLNTRCRKNIHNKTTTQKQPETKTITNNIKIIINKNQQIHNKKKTHTHQTHIINKNKDKQHNNTTTYKIADNNQKY